MPTKTITKFVTLFIALTIGVWQFVYQPINANYDLTRYMMSGETPPLFAALDTSPHNSLVLFSLFRDAFRRDDILSAREYVDRLIWSFDGDLTLWTLYYSKATVQYRQGDLLGALDSLRYSQWLNPKFTPAREMIDQIQTLLESNKGIVIEFSKGDNKP